MTGEVDNPAMQHLHRAQQAISASVSWLDEYRSFGLAQPDRVMPICGREISDACGASSGTPSVRRVPGGKLNECTVILPPWRRI